MGRARPVADVARAVTSIVRSSQASNVVTALAGGLTQEIVPYREELFQAPAVSAPAGLVKALHKVQRHIQESTQAARSLPIQGGTYFPAVTFAAGVPLTIVHNLQVAVAWMPSR